MTPYKLGFLLLSILFWAMTGNVKAQNGFIFDSPKFWEKYQAEKDSEEAWLRGEKWKYSNNIVIVYYNANLYSFIEEKIPYEKDKYVQAKIAQNYSLNAEIEAINKVGLFALSNFDCEAFAGTGSKEKLSANSCKTMKLTSKITSSYEDKAFSIVKLSANVICGCKISLDKGNEKENYNNFFGPIARQEVDRLYKTKNIDVLIDFFTKHYKKKIFGKNEILLLAEIYADRSQINNVTELLGILTKYYAPELTSEEWEKCGDIYYKIDLKDEAYESYVNSSNAIYD
jgi:hypothetical protein